MYRYTHYLVPLCSLLQHASAIHHLKREPLHWVSARDTDVTMQVTNNCGEDIYPAITTQSGNGPPSSGFLLRPGESHSQMVSSNWQGRCWARTNCTFNADDTTSANGSGPACLTGDCGGMVACTGPGTPPATLAEFTLSTPKGQTFYDISMVDGYNLAMGIIYNNSTTNGTSSSNATSNIPPNFTNPICIGTVALLSDMPTPAFETPQYPLALENSMTPDFLSSWCPWPLQLNPPIRPGDGVYPYPDSNIPRPPFNPCLSACAKWGDPQYCCTGSHDSPSTCSPSEYSTNAKTACPDAYSYAFDDQTSTFIIPAQPGAGFEIIFCPEGKSTTIIKTFGSQMDEIASTGVVTTGIRADAENRTYIEEQNGASAGDMAVLRLALLGVVCTSLLVAF
jgi:Thaumatin family